MGSSVQVWPLDHQGQPRCSAPARLVAWCSEPQDGQPNFIRTGGRRFQSPLMFWSSRTNVKTGSRQARFTREHLQSSASATLERRQMHDFLHLSVAPVFNSGLVCDERCHGTDCWKLRLFAYYPFKDSNACINCHRTAMR